jgi:hypothetical protein
MPATAAPLTRLAVAGLREGTDATVERLCADNACPICHDLSVGACLLPCGHQFCGACAFTWLESHGSCPCCRAVAGPPVFAGQMDALLDSFVEPHMEEEARAERLRRKAVWVEQKPLVLDAAARRRKQPAAVVHGPYQLNDARDGIRRRHALDDALSEALRLPMADMFAQMQRFRTSLAEVILMYGEPAFSAAPPPVSAMVRLVSLPHAEMAAELSVLRAGVAALDAAHVRDAVAVASGVFAGAGAGAGADTRDGVWGVDHEPTGLGVCHACFRGIAAGEVRTLFEVAHSVESRAAPNAMPYQRVDNSVKA